MAEHSLQLAAGPDPNDPALRQLIAQEGERVGAMRDAARRNLALALKTHGVPCVRHGCTLYVLRVEPADPEGAEPQLIVIDDAYAGAC